MNAQRSLLGLTLATTFAAGCMSGWSARDLRAEPPFRPTKASSVYAAQLRALGAKGYDTAELAEAEKIHQQYLDSYQHWWQMFLDAHAANLDVVDAKFEEKLADLDARFRARTGRAPGEDGPEKK